MFMSEAIQPIERRVLSRDDFRFELRPYFSGVEDGILEAAMESREEVARWMAWLHPEYGKKDADAWVEYAIGAWDAGTSYEFVIFDRDDGGVVGSCGLNAINRIDLVCNLGYWVRTSKCRLGAASQAAQLIWQFGTEIVGFNRLEIVVAVGNEASRRVAQRVGAVDEGLQRDRLRVSGVAHDAHMFACLRSR